MRFFTTIPLSNINAQEVSLLFVGIMSLRVIGANPPTAAISIILLYCPFVGTMPKF